MARRDDGRGEPARILYVADSLMAGGIESQLVELVTRLDHSCFAPYVLSLYGPRTRDLHYAPQLLDAGVHLYTPDLLWGPADKLRGIATIVHAAREVHPRIIQAEGYHANLLLRMAAPFLPPAIRIGTVRGVHTPKQLLYERLGAPFVARIAVNAPHLATMLEQGAGIPARKIVHIPNGISIQRYAQPSDATLRERLAPNARRVLVSMGRISFEKNMHWIVEALGLLKRQGRLPDGAVRLLIVGPPQHEEAQALLDAAIARDALHEVVSQHPSTPHPEDYYAAADAFVLVSPNEGLPNAVIEALSAGTPSLLSAGANAAGVIEDGITGWVARTGDVTHLAEVLARVIELSDDALTAMRPACRARAEHYSAEHLIERYSAFYDELLRFPRRAGNSAQTPPHDWQDWSASSATAPPKSSGSRK